MAEPAAPTLHTSWRQMTPAPGSHRAEGDAARCDQDPLSSRRSGILVPLFSIPSSRSWGIGEIADITHLATWLEAGGQRVLQLLPINEMPPAERSPYSALSAMAIDPQYISMDAVEDFEAIGGESALSAADRARLDAARAAPRIDYNIVRPLKMDALRRAFAHFQD